MSSNSSNPKQINALCLELLFNQTIPLITEITQHVRQPSAEEIAPKLNNLNIKDIQIGDVTSSDEIEDSLDTVTSTLENIGYSIGLKASEFINYENPHMDLLQDFELLNVMKFICRDIWKYFYGKQIDNLRTNHKGTFVLIDNRFKHFENFCSMKGDDDTLEKSKLYTWLPSGVIRGALKSFDIDSIVTPEIAAFPKVSFHIRTNLKK